MLDLSLIKNSDDFELFCEDILKAIGFTIVSRPARGPGQGKDIISLRTVDDEFDGRQIQRFLVECKHFAASGKSVYESDTKNILERTIRNGCDHYLLITSTEAGVTVRDQIEGINNSKDTVIRATSWYKNDLIKKIYENPSIWEYYTGHRIPPQTKPTYFQSLNSFFRYGSKYAPSENMLLNDLLYLSEGEELIIDSLKNRFSDNNRNKLFTLSGPPASGKTVLSIILAKIVEESGGSAFFHRVTTKTQIKELWEDITKNDFENNLFIFDNCHLNIEIPNDIYANSHLIQNAACLFVSRDISEKVRLSAELDNLDYFDSLAESAYRIDIDESDINKIIGIIEKYKGYYEKVYKKKFKIGDINKILNTIHGNLLALYYFLTEWPEVSSLDQVDKTYVLENIYRRYLSHPTSELILKYAALFQYEISVEPLQKEVPISEMLLIHGILTYDSATEYFGFYHSDFAKLLIEAYERRPTFTRRYIDNNDFSLSQIKSYILGFNNYPANFHEILSNLISNENSILINRLLGDKAIMEICIKYYLHDGTFLNIFQLLSFVQSSMPNLWPMLSNKLIIDNPMIKTVFLSSDSKLSVFIKVINLLEKFDAEYRNKFIALFSSKDIENALYDTPFISTVSALSTLSRGDSMGSKILDLMTLEYLGHEMRKIKLSEVSRVLSVLSKISFDKSMKAFKSLSTDLLAEKAGNEFFSDISLSINSLRNIDKKHSEKIFNNISTSLLISKAKQSGVSFIGLTRSLSDFKKINLIKTNQILKSLNLDVFKGKINPANINFSQIAQGLNLLNNLSTTLSKELLSNIPILELADSAQNESFISFTQAINNISKIDAKIARLIAAKTDIIRLLNEIPTENRLKVVLGKPLSELSNVDMEKAWDILNSFEDVDVIKHLTFSTKNIAEIGNALRICRQIYPEKTRLICRGIDTFELKRISEKGGLNSLFLGLNAINKVDYKKTEQLLSILNLDVIAEKAKQKSTKFQTLVKVLLIFQKISPDITSVLCQSIDYNLIKEKALDSRLDKHRVSNMIEDLSVIDHLKLTSIVNEIKI